MPEGGRGPESGASVAAGPVGSAVGPVAFGARAPDARGARHPVSRVPSGSAPRYVPESLLWSGLPPLAPVEPPVLSVPGPYGAPQLAGTPGSVPVVERPRSTTSTGIAPTARRGAAGPSNRATTPTNRLPRPCRGAPPLHDTIPICCRGASPPPAARIGAARVGIMVPRHVLRIMLRSIPWRGSARRGESENVPWPGAGCPHRSGRPFPASRVPEGNGLVRNPGTPGPPGIPGFGRTALSSVIRDTGRGSASQIPDEVAHLRNPGHWERISIPDYGRRRPFPESGTLSAAQRQESRTKPLFSGIRDTAPVD